MPLAIGSAIVAAGLALYWRIDGGALDYWTDVLPPTSLVAIGMGVSVAPLTTSVMESVDADHVGAAAGFSSAVTRVAGLVATALLGFVFALQASPESFLAALRTAALVGAASAAGAAVRALFVVGSGAARANPAT